MMKIESSIEKDKINTWWKLSSGSELQQNKKIVHCGFTNLTITFNLPNAQTKFTYCQKWYRSLKSKHKIFLLFIVNRKYLNLKIKLYCTSQNLKCYQLTVVKDNSGEDNTK